MGAGASKQNLKTSFVITLDKEEWKDNSIDDEDVS
jgi:hypothetical protein